ncbi:MAG: repeat containing protein [Verrucomicrobiales bacterium]|nr:repeat containing protein [Verrucomicrobiales bacterium]
MTNPRNSPSRFSSRRSFLRNGAGAAAAFAAGAPFIRAEDKSGLKNPILGSGEHTYECIHDWGELPNGIVYGNTHGAAEDSQGRIYVMHTVHRTSPKADAIVVFDADGKFVKSWGADFKGGAHGMHLANEGGAEFLYLCDTARHMVVKTTLDGEVVWQRGCPEGTGGYKRTEEYVPTNVATAPDGTVFVADGYGRNYIHIYKADGTYVSTFGGSGKEPGHTSCPHGLLVDIRGPEPLLVVADRTNARLQYFTLKGEHVRFVTDELRAPCHFHAHGGNLLIPDLNSRVTVFDKDNRLITHLGDGGGYEGVRNQPRTAFKAGQFVAPHSGIFDRNGNIFIVEWVEVGRVTKLKKIV